MFLNDKKHCQEENQSGQEFFITLVQLFNDIQEIVLYVSRVCVTGLQVCLLAFNAPLRTPAMQENKQIFKKYTFRRTQTFQGSLNKAS